MITTNDLEIYNRLLKLRWLGISKDTWARKGENEKYSWHYNVEEVSYKCTMNDITAALGLVQFKKLDRMNNRRREICEKYNKGFADLDWIETPTIKGYAKSACHNYVIKVEERDRLNIYLQKKGISTSVHYMPNNHYEMYKNCRGATPICEEVWTKLLTLPLFPDLTDSEVDMIIQKVMRFKK
jgi:perosamine synthetase